MTMSDKTDVVVEAAPDRAAKPAATGPGTYLVEVNLRQDFSDAEGISALWLLHCAGVSTARSVRVGRLYDLRGPLNLGHVHLAARDLLCDCVTQEFRIRNATAASALNGGLWRVEVWLKTTVTDTVGESVRDALIDLGLPAVAVRCGWAYHIEGKCGRNQLDKAVSRSLANPIIHRFIVHEAH
jgi:phosphoribosylformylglycinamidine (FGAM) synthase PurS component